MGKMRQARGLGDHFFWLSMDAVQYSAEEKEYSRLSALYRSHTPAQHYLPPLMRWLYNYDGNP